MSEQIFTCKQCHSVRTIVLNGQGAKYNCQLRTICSFIDISLPTCSHAFILLSCVLNVIFFNKKLGSLSLSCLSQLSQFAVIGFQGHDIMPFLTKLPTKQGSQLGTRQPYRSWQNERIFTDSYQTNLSQWKKVQKQLFRTEVIADSVSIFYPYIDIHELNHEVVKK